MTRIQIQPITAEDFSPFGTLLTARPGCARLNFAAPVNNFRPNAKANLAIVRPPVAVMPCCVTLMERHAYSTQAFMPLGGVRALLFVAPGGDAGPDLTQARAFAVPGDIGISYHVGTWHMGMALLDQPGSMAMLVHEDGSAADTEFRVIAAVELSAAAAAE